MKKLLVTGGAGFIGSNFIRYMLNKYEDYKIINLDVLTYCGNLENLKNVENHPNYNFIKGDITDRELVDRIVSDNIDYIINFAAESHVDRSIEDPQVFLKTNVLGTQNLLDMAKKHWAIDKDENGYPIYKKSVKFIQISTDEVYGSLGEIGYFTEETPLRPRNPYSASKASADLIALAYADTYKFPLNITRCSNNYGPYQFPEKLIPLIISNALENKDVPVYGDGLNIRDWLYVEDHCRAIDLVLHDGEIGQVYNIGGNNEKANIEMVKLIIEKLNKSKTLIKHVGDRLGHDRRYAINNTKITTELKWKPNYTFEKGIEETLQWYLQNKKWLNKIKRTKFQDILK